YRAAFFHRHPAELRELDDAEQLEAQGLRALERQPDGKLRIAGPYVQELRDRRSGSLEQLDWIKPYEKPYLQLVSGVADAEVRRPLSSETAILFLISRVIRQANEGSQTPIGSVNPGDEDQKIEPSIAFTIDIAELAPSVKDCDAILPKLKERIDSILPGLAG